MLAISTNSNHYHLEINLDISYSISRRPIMTIQQQRYPQRVRNALRFRELTVLRVERVGAGFQRIVLGGEALEGFTSRGFDDHTKVFFPQPGSQFTPHR
jgi:ferric-chelate reductase (NADPH)